MNSTKCKSMKLFITSWLIATAFLSTAQVKLPRLFTDHMVLQRNQPVRFWGEAPANQLVTVKIDGFSTSTKADANGKWELLFPSHQAGGPYEVKVGEINIKDVWFGDVWVAGGQSNMEWKLSWGVNNWEEEVNDSDYPQIRFFEVPNVMAVEPKASIPSGDWKIASPKTSGEFSAIAWFFAKRNHLDKNVPVGVIDSNWGGTPAETWLSARSLQEVPGYETAALEMLDPAIDWELRMKENQDRDDEKWRLINDKETFFKLGAHKVDYDDSEWSETELPNGKPLHDFVWVRREISLKNGKSATMYLGDINQICHVFFNGTLVSEETWQDSTSTVEISASLIQKGKNVIAIRAINSWDNNVWIGRKGQMWIKQGKNLQSLEGAWKFTNNIEPKMPEVDRFNWRPGVLYNAMIHPIVGYSIRGAIWYQGESNGGKPELYRDLFSTMIQEWRIQWKQGNFPFLFVQLANYMKRKPDPTESNWAELREAQTQTLSLPNTGMATIIDIGDADDIHPRNKQDVGLRLWLAARNVSFGEDITFSGPIYQAMEVDGNKVRLSFDQVTNGLVVKGDELQGFAITGEDKEFVWAKGKVDGKEVVVWSDQVSDPKYVRYAWGDNPACNLYNAEGLPAVPFRTDK